MKRKNIIIFIVTLLLLIVALFLVFNNRDETYRGRLKDFAVKDTASITKVFLADKNNHTLLLERKADGSWLLNEKYKARSSGVNLLFETFKNLATRYPVPNKAHNSVISQLAARSVKVEIYQNVYRINLFNRIRLFQHVKLTKTYFVGGPTPDNQGTFMLMEGSEIPFVVQLLGFRGFVGPRYSTMEQDWRDHTVFRARLSDIKSVIMEMPLDPENSFRVDKDENNLTLEKLSPKQIVPSFDTLKLLNFLTSFADLRYESLLNDIDSTRKDSISHSIPKNILTVIDTKGDSTTIVTFNKPNDSKAFDMEGNLYIYDKDRLYALVNDKRDFVLIQYFVFDKVLKPLSYFLPDK